jgi:hypothetical protein
MCSANKKPKDFQDHDYGITQWNSKRTPQPHYLERSMLSHKTNKRHSKTSSKSTFRKATYAHPKALTPPPSSSLKRRMDDCDQSKITDD